MAGGLGIGLGSFGGFSVAFAAFLFGRVVSGLVSWFGGFSVVFCLFSLWRVVSGLVSAGLVAFLLYIFGAFSLWWFVSGLVSASLVTFLLFWCVFLMAVGLGTGLGCFGVFSVVVGGGGGGAFSL